MTGAAGSAWRSWGIGLGAALALALQIPGWLSLSIVSAILAVVLLAWAERSALSRLWQPRFWGLTLVVALGAGLFLAPPTHDIAGVPLSRTGAELALVLLLRALALFALVTLGVTRLTEARLIRITAHLGFPALGSACYRALALVPEFLAAGRDEWRLLAGRHALRRPGAVAAALLVRATCIAEGGTFPGAGETSREGELTVSSVRPREAPPGEDS